MYIIYHPPLPQKSLYKFNVPYKEITALAAHTCGTAHVMLILMYAACTLIIIMCVHII